MTYVVFWSNPVNNEESGEGIYNPTPSRLGGEKLTDRYYICDTKREAKAKYESLFDLDRDIYSAGYARIKDATEPQWIPTLIERIQLRIIDFKNRKWRRQNEQ